MCVSRYRANGCPDIGRSGVPIWVSRSGERVCVPIGRDFRVVTRRMRRRGRVSRSGGRMGWNGYVSRSDRPDRPIGPTDANANANATTVARANGTARGRRRRRSADSDSDGDTEITSRARSRKTDDDENDDEDDDDEDKLARFLPSPLRRAKRTELCCGFDSGDWSDRSRGRGSNSTRANEALGGRDRRARTRGEGWRRERAREASEEE